MEKQYKYEVALSFASEQRDYVKRVSDELDKLGIAHFYDSKKKVALWGKNLAQHLDQVYSKDSKYFVIFISKEYLEKNWTNLEIRSALDRNLKEREENFQQYILPVRFDNTEIPGLCSTTGELNAKTHTPEEVACNIAKKLNHITDHADIESRNINNVFGQFAEFMKTYTVKHYDIDFVEENEFLGLNFRGANDRFICSCRKIGETIQMYFDDDRTENPAALLLVNELANHKPFKLINNACLSIPHIECDMTSNEVLSCLNTEINYYVR